MLLFKVIVLGDAGVGKTSIMNNYKGDPFNESDPPTIGVEFGSKTINIQNIITAEEYENYKKKILENFKGFQVHELHNQAKIQIWNTSGQERFHSITTSYYRGVHAVIFVCDLTRRDSLDHLDYWINDFKKNTTIQYEKVSKIIMGNKSDLVDKQEITESMLNEFSNKHDGMPYFIVSAKSDREKIKSGFEYLAAKTFEMYMECPEELCKKMECISNLGNSQKKSNCCVIS